MITQYEAPRIIKDFLTYLETIRGKSPKTVYEYFLDIRTFFRFFILKRGLCPKNSKFDDISINVVDIALVKSVALSDVYDFLNYISHYRPKYHKSKSTPMGAIAVTRARKVSSLRSFYKYLSDKAHVIDVNIMQNLDSPKIRQTLPRHLTLDDSINLLSSVDGDNKERDYCILTLFLNCGLRVSELVGINLSDIQGDTLKVIGKGDKERTVYLNESCIDALAQYLKVRQNPKALSKNALFISRLKNRINVQTVKWLVKKHIENAGLDARRYSAHKLRHTAATLMYQNGVDIRTLKDILGHKNLDTTMIYTHVSDINMKNAAKANPLSKIKRKNVKNKK